MSRNGLPAPAYRANDEASVAVGPRAVSYRDRDREQTDRSRRGCHDLVGELQRRVTAGPWGGTGRESDRQFDLEVGGTRTGWSRVSAWYEEALRGLDEREGAAPV